VRRTIRRRIHRNSLPARLPPVGGQRAGAYIHRHNKTEDAMNHESNIADWKKELRVLLDKIQTESSGDQSAARDRIAVLNRLIAGAGQPVTA
jgi:hypothetical protein